MRDAGITVRSFQGFFFDFIPLGDLERKSFLKRRTNEILILAHKLKVKKFIVGAPELRKSAPSKKLIDELVEVFTPAITDECMVHLENLATQGRDSFSPSQTRQEIRDVQGFELCFDLGNLDCVFPEECICDFDSHSFDNKAEIYQVNSGRGSLSHSFRAAEHLTQRGNDFALEMSFGSPLAEMLSYADLLNSGLNFPEF